MSGSGKDWINPKRDITMLNIGLTHFMVLSFLLVGAGVATMLTKRNAIGILIGVELVLNAAALNLVALGRFHPWNAGIKAAAGAGSGASSAAGMDGAIFAMFVIVLAAAEAAVALAIFLNFYNNFSSIDVERAKDMQG